MDLADMDMTRWLTRSSRTSEETSHDPRISQQPASFTSESPPSTRQQLPERRPDSAHLQRRGQNSCKSEVDNDLRRREEQQRRAYLLQICRGLMEYGAPTHRLEEYMQNSAAVLGLSVQSFYLPGCMLLSFSETELSTGETRTVRCTQRLDLAKLYKVREVYKDIIHSRTTLEAAAVDLHDISKSRDQFRRPVRILVYGIASMCIGPVSYSARPIDLPLIFLLGCLLGWSELFLAPRSELFSQIYEISTTIIIAFLARALGSIKLPHNQSFCFSALCQASIVMILPGFLITNSALELQCKHMIAGSVRLVYGLVFVLFLAFGITIGTTIYGALDASASSATGCSPQWPVWWQLVFVPLFTVAWLIVNQAPWRKMPTMVVITVAGWCVNHFSGQYFSANITISQTLGALTIGLAANLCSRLGHGFAAALLHPAIFIQVPGSFAASGGLVSGVQSANALNNRTVSADGVDQSGQQELLRAAFTMIEIAIGITVGLSVSALMVYPIRKKTSKSGIFSF